jgi:hypothetical protein
LLEAELAFEGIIRADPHLCYGFCAHFAARPEAGSHTLVLQAFHAFLEQATGSIGVARLGTGGGLTRLLLDSVRSNLFALHRFFRRFLTGARGEQER